MLQSLGEESEKKLSVQKNQFKVVQLRDVKSAVIKAKNGLVWMLRVRANQLGDVCQCVSMFVFRYVFVCLSVVMCLYWYVSVTCQHS